MKQYCRYCAHCHYGDAVYCSIYEKTMSESTAKSSNRCKKFAFAEIDVFDTDKTYKPRKGKPEKPDQITMQI